MKEFLMPIIGYEGLYEISYLGCVRSIDRMVVTEAGVLRQLKGQVIAPRINNRGYIEVRLHKNGVSKTHFVHRLVVETFIGHIEKGLEVNHKNGNPKCNEAGNLEIVTHRQNIQHAYDTGLISRKSKSVIDRCTGKVYPSLSEAALCSRLHSSTLKNYLNGNRRNPTCMEYLV